MAFIKKQLLLVVLISSFCYGQDVDEYSECIKKNGDDPIHFVQQNLETYDLLLFDDGVHQSYEAFRFYIDLINDPETDLDFVFIETFGISAQPHIDAYLNNEQKDKTLLSEVFQNDFSGFGWRYETYLDLLSAVWDRNNAQTDELKKIKIIGVDQPVYWEGIHTRLDYDIFLKSLTARDYYMYLIIKENMDNFSSGKKGIFLSNTRHVYKNIKNSQGNPYWNTGTFFYNWHPDKTYSIRIYNVMLNMEKADTEKKAVTAEGLDNIKYSWTTPENGTWDEAFRQNNNNPVAFSLKDNLFGQTKYIGNHMLNVQEGLTMYDAYDALVFLAPIDQLHFSAKMDYFYTKDFKNELIRRINIIYGEDIESFLQKNNAGSIEEFMEEFTKYQQKAKNDFMRN